MGLTPVSQPNAALAEQIVALHRPACGTATYKLRNVWHHPLADGELLLFDLVDTSGDGDSITAHQAVAIRSDTLQLPPLMFYPKADFNHIRLRAGTTLGRHQPPGLAALCCRAALEVRAAGPWRPGSRMGRGQDVCRVVVPV